MAHPGRAYRLYPEERTFLNMVLDKAVAKVQTKDMKLCVAIDQYRIDLEDHMRGDAFLRDVVQKAIRDNGTKVFQRLMYLQPNLAKGFWTEPNCLHCRNAPNVSELTERL
jgi:hypothetical protein